jgi:hypothetical protein
VPAALTSALLLCAALLLWRSRTLRRLAVAEGPYQASNRMFAVGASVYLLTFVLSSNFDYRLVFLILCVPYVLRIGEAWLRVSLLGLIAVASNYGLLVARLDVLGYVLVTLAKALLLVLLTAILLEEIRHGLSRGPGAAPVAAPAPAAP